jgi:hypothetical protein
MERAKLLRAVFVNIQHLTGRTSEFSNIESRLCCPTSYKLSMSEDSFLPNSGILVPRQYFLPSG